MTVYQWIKSTKGIVNALFAATATTVLDTICYLIEKRKRIVRDGAVITGLIVALIVSVTAP